MAAPNLNAVVTALLKQVQKAEDAFFQVITSRFLGFAEGVQLDALGRLVGEERLARTDDAYRKAIRLRIYINGSSGHPEDLIYIARALTGLPVVNYFDVAGSNGNCRLVIPGWTPDSGELLAFLQKICPAGVRLISVSPTDTFVPKRMGERLNTPFTHA